MTRAVGYLFRSEMRLFLAIDIPEEVKDEIVNVQGQLKPHIRAKYVERDNLHVTLKFLGEIEDTKVLERLKDISFSPFKATLSTTGAFPNMNYIKIIWIGIKQGAEQIIGLHNKIESVIPFEKDRNFHPHITVARVKSKVDEKARKIMSSVSVDAEFPVKEFVLYKSTLTPSGPVYEKVSSYPIR